MFDYMKRRASSRSYFVDVGCMVFLIATTLALLINTKSSITSSTDMIHLLVLTLLSLHNQEFYLIPITVALILIVCPKISIQELYWLQINTTRHQFHIVETTILVVAYVLCVAISTEIFWALYPQEIYFSLQNSVIGLCFLILHVFGILIICLILELLILFFNKTKAYLIFILLMYMDIYLLSKYNFSILVGNGLTMDTSSFDLIIAIKNLILNYVYLYLFKKYSDSFVERWLAI